MNVLSQLVGVGFLVVIAATACGSTSGDTSDPVVASGGSPTVAGEAALSDEPLDPLTCQGALANNSDAYFSELQSLTEMAQASDEAVNTMCAAVYQTSTPGDPFLTVALINFDEGQFAVARYDLLKAAFVAAGGDISEADGADDVSIGRFSVLVDADGIGRTTVLRKTTWILTISAGPTTGEAPWTATDLEVIGQSILNRADA